MTLSETLSPLQCRQITEWVLENILHGHQIWSVRGDGSFKEQMQFRSLEPFDNAAKEFRKVCLNRKEVAELIQQNQTDVRQFLKKHFTSTMELRLLDQEAEFFADVKKPS